MKPIFRVKYPLSVDVGSVVDLVVIKVICKKLLTYLLLLLLHGLSCVSSAFVTCACGWHACCFRLFGCEKPWDEYICWILLSTGVWSAGIFTIRYTLKALLFYHAWMYEHRSNLSLLTKLWLVIIHL